MIATRRFLTKFRSAAAVMLAGDPDLYLKIPAGPSYDGFAFCFANFVPGPDPRRSTHRTKGDRTTCR
jgi:hypothetical protein